MRQKNLAFVNTYSVSCCKQTNTALSDLVDLLAFTRRNIPEDGKYLVLALVKKSLAILRLSRLLNEGFR